MTIFTKDPNVSGVFSVNFVATEPRFGIVDNSVKFSVDISCSYVSELIPSITENNPTDIVYIIRGSDPVTFKMPDYEWKPSKCATKLKYTLEDLSSGQPSSIYPTFLKYNADLRTVTLDGDKKAFGERDKVF